MYFVDQNYHQAGWKSKYINFTETIKYMYLEADMTILGQIIRYDNKWLFYHSGECSTGFILCTLLLAKYPWFDNNRNSYSCMYIKLCCNCQCYNVSISSLLHHSVSWLFIC